jgi:hypothetical protein
MIITGKTASSFAAAATLLSLLTACNPPPPTVTQILPGETIPPNETCFPEIAGSVFGGGEAAGTPDAGSDPAFLGLINELNHDGDSYSLWCYPDAPPGYTDWVNTDTLPPTPVKRCETYQTNCVPFQS